MKRPKTIVLLGGGRVGGHLARVCATLDGYELIHHYQRRLGMSLSDIPRNANLYIYALSDEALEEVWQQMPPTQGVWLHVSGSTTLAQMQRYHDGCAVMYPLQTFSAGAWINWQEVPIYYEGHEEARLLAEALSSKTYHADSIGRRKLHLAAVLACNYSNYLVTLAEECLSQEGFDPKTLLPLLRETFHKLEQLPAAEAQTGPAIRGDRTIIEKHKEMLSGDSLAVYSLLAEQLLARCPKASAE